MRVALYIDPGTGSMLFAAIMGIAAAVLFFLQKAWVKFKFFITGGRSKADENKHGILVFSEGKRYWNHFEPILRELERRGEPTEYWTMDQGDPALSVKEWQHVHCTFIGEGNRGFARLNLANARVCLATTPGLDVYQWKRSQNVGWYAHIFHAIDSATSYRMFGLDHYDAVLLTGAFQEGNIRRLEQLRGLPAKELEVVGLPYMDELKKRAEQAREASAGAQGERGDAERTVLLAPTWGPSGILTRFGEEIIDALLATGYHIAIRPHPQSMVSEKELMERLRKKYEAGAQIEWNFDSDNFEILRRSDILISDFSGVIFDYALVFDRPVIYADTSYDSTVYDQAWLEHESRMKAAGVTEGAEAAAEKGEIPPEGRLWQFTVLERFGVQLKEEDFGRLKEVIDRAIGDTTLQKARDEVRAEAWQNMGHAAASIADYLVRRRDALAAEDPGAAGEPEAEQANG